MKFNFNDSPRKSAHSSRGSGTGVGKTVSKKVTANIGGSGGTGGGGGGGFPGSGSGNNLTSGGQYDVSRYNPVHDHLEIGSLIEDWMPRDASGLHQMWRLIYLRDAIVGPAVDLYSSLPYSECRLTGIDDPEVLRVYQDTMERLDVVTAMPELVKEFLTIGKFCSSLIFDSRKGVFVDWTHHDPDFLRIEPIPVRGFDPKIDLVASPALKNFLHSMDDRDMAVREQLPEEYFRELEKQGTYKLNPLSTIFVPRRASPYDNVGTSFLTRIVSFWALEKSLIESTVTNARRRTRSILHINAGLENLWEPTEEELEAISGLFIQADEDPVGAVVTTRTGVETNEIRSGDDFWKLSDEWAFLTEGKMRALGISDAFLCLSGNTYIPTVDRGIVKIENFLDKERIPNFQPNTPYDGRDIIVNSQYGPGTVDSWVYSGKKNVHKLKTFSGYELEATKKHKVAVLRDAEIIWPELSDITEEDFVIVPTKECTRSEPLSLDRKISRTEISKIPAKNKILFPKQMSPDLAFILGSIVSEGCVDEYRTRFCNSSKDLVDVYVDKVKKVFGLTSFIYNKEAQGKISIAGIDTNSTKMCMDVNTNSKQLSVVLSKLGVKLSEKGLAKKNSYFKVIPWSIMEADAQSQLSFLAAFLEGDGTVNYDKRTISFISYSNDIREQLQIMLTSHGIVSNRRDKSVNVHGTFAIRLMKKLKPYLIDKYVKFDDMQLNHSRYGLPSKQFVRKAEERIVKVTNRGVNFKTEGGGDICIKGWVASLPPNIMYYDSYKKGEYNNWLNMLRRVAPKTYGQAVDLLEEEYYLDKVDTVEDTGNTVDTYDLMMNSNCDRSFVASGILTHNSGDATYNNMETALSVFMETLRTLRSYMDRRIFYEKIFATLARVHGFVKKDAKRGPTNLRRTMDYRKAMQIPKEDLLMPKIVWDKKLQPEGDMNFMEMLQTADEAGVPITMKQWASGAGLNLEEMMEDLNEDAQYRKKIAEWRKQFTGDQAMEQEVMSGEGLRSIPVWDESNNFVVLSSNEALDILEHFLENKRNMLKLTNADETMRTISSMVDGHALKTELMAYLLRRLGVGTELPIDGRAVEAIGEHLYRIGTKTESSKVKKAVHAEFQTLARVMSKDIPKERKLALLEGMSKRQDMTRFTPKAVTGV